MINIDKRNKFSKEIFTYRVNKDGKVFIYYEGKQVLILKGKEAKKFLEKIDGLDSRNAQVVMAKITGNFKRSNGRPKRS